MVVNFDRNTYNTELLLPTKLEKLKPGFQIGPLWLRPLLTANFFTTCEVHGDGNRNECNLYCLDCRGDALCSGCAPQHRDHHVVQIRRSSYHDVVRVSELQKVLDLGGVQTYIINSARVVFLNARPQPRHAKGVTKTCEICDRSLLDTFRYCSLGCKLTGIRRHNDMTFHLQPKNPQPPPQQQQQVLDDSHRQAGVGTHHRDREEEQLQGVVVDHESLLAPAIPARSGVTSEESSGGSSAVVGKRTRSSRKSANAGDQHDHHQHFQAPREEHVVEQEDHDRKSSSNNNKSSKNKPSSVSSRSVLPVVIDQDTSSIQRSLGTLKLGRSSPSSSPCVSVEETSAAGAAMAAPPAPPRVAMKSKKPPGSPMAVNSPELSPPTPPPTRTAKRRKGTPHRAPFGSAICM